MNNAVLWDQPALRKPSWLERVGEVWPELADLADEHARRAEAALEAAADRSRLVGKFNTEDNDRITALAEGRPEGKVTTEQDRQAAFHEAEVKAEAAELALANACEDVLAEIRERAEAMYAGLEGAEKRARDRQSAARAELEAAERVVLALRPAQFWLKRTLDGISHHPLVDFDVPLPDLRPTLGEFAGRLAS